MLRSVHRCQPSLYIILMNWSEHPSIHLKYLTVSEAAKLASKMAEYLASIFGTEKDKVNCSFFFKVRKFQEKCANITTLDWLWYENVVLRRVPAPTGRDALGSTTSRHFLRLSCSKISTSTLKTRPKLPMEAISPMSPMRRCRSQICQHGHLLKILVWNCVCFNDCNRFFLGALWQLLWGCVCWVRGQVWTGRKILPKMLEKVNNVTGGGDERVR